MSNTNLSLSLNQPQPSARPVSVYRLIKIFQKWLFIPNPGGLLAVLGAYAANLLDGDPVWLFLVGPSSAGKTQILMSLDGLPNVHVSSTLTEGGLLSGTPKKERAKDAKGGLLNEIGESGIILLKDFTSTLSMSHETRAATLAALREIYDGRWTRQVGVDGGRTLSWEGKVGLIAGCTQTIDTHHAVMAAMGQRFLFYRMRAVDERTLAMRALEQSNAEEQMRSELRQAVQEFFEVVEPAPHALTEDSKERIAALGTLTARARSSVERDGRTREIELIPQAESPARLSKQLGMLLQGLLMIGAREAHAWKVVTHVALDCVPSLRRSVFDVVRLAKVETDTAGVADKISYPIQTTRRALEELAAHGVLEKRAISGKEHYWSLSKWARVQCSKVFTTVPENAVGGR